MEKLFNHLFESKRPEHEFLPAALEIQQSPPSPIGRAVLWSMCIFLVITLLWSIIGTLDIIAVAQGKIVPNDRVKTIQPLENAVVSQILVKDGDEVKAGQVLVVLDTRQTISDVNSLSAQLEEKQARLAALDQLESIITKDGSDTKYLSFPSGMNHSVVSRQRHLYTEQVSDFQSAIKEADQSVKRQQEDLASSQSEIHKQEQLLVVLTKKANAYRAAYEIRAVSEIDYLNIEQQRLEIENNLNTERSRYRSLIAALNQAKEAMGKLVSETRVTYSREKTEIASQIESIKQELNKANTRNGLQTLTSPIDGVVQGMTVFTVGGVVTEAEKIMQIVPVNGGLEVEAYISNKDIGFVQENQHVTVKIDAFNFTKYGTIDGTILDISNDAFQDEKMGLIFKTRVGLKKEDMLIDGRTINLGPGMSVTAEVVTGNRRVIEFIVNPVRKILNESATER